jgi:hypothetical protein
VVRFPWNVVQLLKEIELASPDSKKKEKIKKAEYNFGNSEGNTSLITFLYSALKSVVLGVRKQRFPARPAVFFTLQAETRGNCIVRLVFNNVDRRKRQFILNKIFVSSHLQL